MKLTPEELRYLELLSKQYPSIQKASTEIINLRAILSLPKGTEHFLSDLHGEYETFTHLLNSASGFIRTKINELFRDALPSSVKESLATLIYYPEEKLKLILREEKDPEGWYKVTLHRLIKVCRSVSAKYTRSKVRKTLPRDFAYVIEELLHEDENQIDKQQYYDGIIDAIVSTGRAGAFIMELCVLIRRLTIDRLHIVGDIFDRGPHPDLILDELMKYQAVDIQWGNHDIVWMGAALGSLPLLATLIRFAARYDNLDTVEDAYGINMLPLATFAMQVYKDDPCDNFRPRISHPGSYREDELRLVSQMHKAIAVIQFKLEAQVIKKHPEFGMNDRLLLEHIDPGDGTVEINRKKYRLNDTFFPTVDPDDPYRLTSQEQEVIERLRRSFLKSPKLQQHLRFLINKGSMYLAFNDNLIFHGCIPMTSDGHFQKVRIGDAQYGGKALLDKFDERVRHCYYHYRNTGAYSDDLDYLYYLWAGPASPLFGKTRMATFERYFLDDPETHEEEKNPYFLLRDQTGSSMKILQEFGLDAGRAHIINGHMPVKLKKGEDPVKAGGKLIVIDGGLSRAYQPVTGTAGYTLIYDSYGLMLATHDPFKSKQKALQEGHDIVSSIRVLEKSPVRKRVRDTDVGEVLLREISGLEKLLQAYRKGIIKEKIST